MSGCGCSCGEVNKDEAGRNPAYVRTLWGVVVANGAMFLLGVVLALRSGSAAVGSDVLDFLGDAVATGIGLVLVGHSARTRARAALGQGLALGTLGLFVLGTAAWRLVRGEPPEPLAMGVYGVLGLAVNLGAALALLRHRHGDASVRAVWLYSRNDAIGNVAVLASAGAVALTASRWPDVLTAVAIALLFLHSAWGIVGAARRELR